MDLHIYKETKLYAVFVDSKQIERTTQENRMNTLTEIVSKNKFFFNVEQVIHNEEFFFIVNFTDETAQNVTYDMGKTLTSSAETLFHKYEGTTSINKLQKRKKL